jgi:hypothetical protein
MPRMTVVECTRSVQQQQQQHGSKQSWLQTLNDRAKHFSMHISTTIRLHCSILIALQCWGQTVLRHDYCFDLMQTGNSR